MVTAIKKKREIKNGLVQKAYYEEYGTEVIIYLRFKILREQKLLQ